MSDGVREEGEGRWREGEGRRDGRREGRRGGGER